MAKNKKETFVKVVSELFRKTDMEVFAGEDYEDVMSYFNALKVTNTNRSGNSKFTENGKIILQYMKENEGMYNNMFKAKDFEAAGLTARSASSSMRKLVADGYIEKLGDAPIIYSLLPLGREVNLEED